MTMTMTVQDVISAGQESINVHSILFKELLYLPDDRKSIAVMLFPFSSIVHFDLPCSKATEFQPVYSQTEL